jgi:hypothetical protein
MKPKIYSLTSKRRLSLLVLMIVTGLGIQAFSLQVRASEQQIDSITHNNAIQYQRCKGKWRYRCSSNLSTKNSVDTDTIVTKLDEKTKFHRCGRLWQYRCAGEVNAPSSSANFVRQEYLESDRQNFDEENGNLEQQDYADGSPRFSRCGRFWKFYCGES